MPTEQQLFDITMEADADLSAKQFYIMKISAARRVNISTAVGDNLLGVLQDKPNAAGKAGTVRVIGISKLIAGGTISAGNPLTTDSAGKAVASAPAAGVNHGRIGWALEAAVSGDVFTALILPQMMQGA